MNAKKTYIVKGLTEWTAQIPVGGARISVPFTGGIISKFGAIPARFTTSNPALQKIIENSEHFRSRRILIE